MRRGSVLWLLCTTSLFLPSGTATRTENVSAFLVPGEASSCDAQRSCSEVTFGYDRSCLNSSIPWDVPYLQVRCAFRCCLYYWQRKLGLDEVQRVRARELKDRTWFAFDPHEVLIHRYTVEQISTIRQGGVSPDWFPKHGVAYEIALGTFSRTVARQSPLEPAVYSHPADNPFSGKDKGSNVCTERDKGIDCYLPSPFNTSVNMHALPMGFYCPARYYNATFKQRKEVDRSDATRPVLLGCGCCTALGRNLVKTNGWMRPDEELASGHKETHRTYVHKILRRNGFPCDCTDVWQKHRGNEWNPRLKFPQKGAKHYMCPPRDYADVLTSRKFTISPYGHGWANFREWEVLGLGGIPLVDFHPGTTELYRDLPVLQVKNWSHVTPRFLEAEWARFMSTDFDMKRAFWPWWFLTLTRNMTAKSHDGPLNPLAVEIKSRTEERWARQGRDPRIPGFPEPASHAAILNILLSRGES